MGRRRCCRRYADVVCVLHADPDGPVPEAMLGDLELAQATAPGKALLAHRTSRRESILAQPPTATHAAHPHRPPATRPAGGSAPPAPIATADHDALAAHATRVATALTRALTPRP